MVEKRLKSYQNLLYIFIAFILLLNNKYFFTTKNELPPPAPHPNHMPLLLLRMILVGY